MDNKELYKFIAEKTKKDENKVSIAINSFNKKVLDSVLLNKEVGIWKNRDLPAKFNIELLKTKLPLSYLPSVMKNRKEFAYRHFISFNTSVFENKEMKIVLDPEIKEKIINYVSLTKTEYRYVH